MSTTSKQRDPVEADLLDSAERLFYARGIQAVGVDQIRADSGLALKRIYGMYPGKEQLVLAYLARRDTRWRGQLAAYVDTIAEPEQRVLAVFDWLHRWFAEPDFHGCAWINAHGELGPSTPAVAAAVRKHKRAFRRYLTRLLTAGGYSPALGRAIYLLAEGAMVSAAIHADPKTALHARDAASQLLSATRPSR